MLPRRWGVIVIVTPHWLYVFIIPEHQWSAPDICEKYTNTNQNTSLIQNLIKANADSWHFTPIVSQSQQSWFKCYWFYFRAHRERIAWPDSLKSDQSTAPRYNFKSRWNPSHPFHCLCTIHRMDKCGFAQGKSKHTESQGLFAYSSGKNRGTKADPLQLFW